jgi:hypothetical protein
MAQNLTLNWDERARVTLATEYEDGTLVDPGRGWSWVAVPTGVAVVTGAPGAYYIEAKAAGTTTLSFTVGEFTETAQVTVMAPLAVRLVVSIGPAELKA